MPQFPTVRLHKNSQVFSPHDEERSPPIARGVCAQCATVHPPGSCDTVYRPYILIYHDNSLWHILSYKMLDSKECL